MSPSVRVRFVAPQRRSPHGGRNAPLAQLVERRPLKSMVLGSSPRRCTNLALVSQLDRGPGYEPGSCAFESRRGHCDRGVAGLHARLWLWRWRFDSARSPHATPPASGSATDPPKVGCPVQLRVGVPMERPAESRRRRSVASRVALTGVRVRPPPSPLQIPWPNGKAADCNSAFPGSIPGGISKVLSTVEYAVVSRRRRGWR